MVSRKTIALTDDARPHPPAPSPNAGRGGAADEPLPPLPGLGEVVTRNTGGEGLTALPLAGPDRAERVRDMFARIVPRYDLMNRLMTGAQDGRWRRLTAQAARPAGAVALDLATGTGDLAIELARLGARRVVAAD